MASANGDRFPPPSTSAPNPPSSLSLSLALTELLLLCLPQDDPERALLQTLVRPPHNPHPPALLFSSCSGMTHVQGSWGAQIWLTHTGSVFSEPCVCCGRLLAWGDGAPTPPTDRHYETFAPLHTQCRRVAE